MKKQPGIWSIWEALVVGFICGTVAICAFAVFVQITTK